MRATSSGLSTSSSRTKPYTSTWSRCAAVRRSLSPVATAAGAACAAALPMLSLPILPLSFPRGQVGQSAEEPNAPQLLPEQEGQTQTEHEAQRDGYHAVDGGIGHAEPEQMVVKQVVVVLQAGPVGRLEDVV